MTAPPKRFASTSTMAYIIDRTEDWLRKKRYDCTFVEGVHYHIPPGERNIFWDVEAVCEWVRTSDPQADEVLQRVLS